MLPLSLRLDNRSNLNRAHFAFFHGRPLRFGFLPGFFGSIPFPGFQASFGPGGARQQVVEDNSDDGGHRHSGAQNGLKNITDNIDHTALCSPGYGAVDDLTGTNVEVGGEPEGYAQAREKRQADDKQVARVVQVDDLQVGKTDGGDHSKETDKHGADNRHGQGCQDGPELTDHRDNQHDRRTAAD